MNSPTTDIVAILEASSQGLDLTFETNLFIAHQPDEPNECVTVYDTGGYPPPSTWLDIERPTIQVMIRGTRWSYTDTYALAENVKNALHGIVNETWNSTRYISIFIEGDVNFIGFDDNKRPLFSMNFAIERTPT